MLNSVLLTNSATQTSLKNLSTGVAPLQAHGEAATRLPNDEMTVWLSPREPRDRFETFSAPEMAKVGGALSYAKIQQHDAAATCSVMPWTEFKPTLVHMPHPSSAGATRDRSNTKEPESKTLFEPKESLIEGALGALGAIGACPDWRDDPCTSHVSKYDQHKVKLFITASRQYFDRGPNKR
jgi:hypothetical protein